MNPDNRFLATFMQCVAHTMYETSLKEEFHDALRACLVPDTVRGFFMQHGYDGAEVTAPALKQCAYALGLPPSKPLRTFADMLECVKQHQQGLVTDSELILALQCTPHQVVAVIQYSRIPYKIHSKVSLADWDEDVAMHAERGDAIPPFALL